VIHNSLVLTILSYGFCIMFTVLGTILCILALIGLCKYCTQEENVPWWDEITKEEIVVTAVQGTAALIVASFIDYYILY